MKRILLTSAMCVALISPAFAWGTADAQTPAPAPIYNTNITKNWASYLAAVASQQQSQTSSNSNRNHNVANGGAGGNSNVGNSGNITFQANRALAASAYAPSFAGSAPCAGKSQSGGIQIPWVGGSEGTQDLDDACRLERNGDTRGARYLLCTENKDIRKALYQEAQDRAVGGELADPCPDDRDTFAKWWFANQHQEVLNPPVPMTPVQKAAFTKPDWCLHPATKAAKNYVATAASCQ